MAVPLAPDQPGRLFLGDNLDVMRRLPDACIDLIYADPPFFSGRDRTARSGQRSTRFVDTWAGGLPDYLEWLSVRLAEMRRLLKPTGSLCVHLDWHASHYVKIELDRIFGYDNFRNEIIWYYQSGGRATRSFSRKHDVIFWYTNGPEWQFFPARVGLRRDMCELCDQPMEQWNHLRRHVDEDGRVYRTIKSAGKIYRYYDDEPVLPADVWLDINHIQQRDPQRAGYPTQKPEALLERLILALTQEGDLVADFFCGSGTTLVVAQRLGRRWLAADRSPEAVALTARRVAPDGSMQNLAIEEVDHNQHE